MILLFFFILFLCISAWSYNNFFSPPQRLSTTSVPFTVLSMTHNPCNEDLLVVCGLTECQMLVINSSGQVTSRSLLHPSVGSTGYIVKAIWVPGSKHELVLATDSFVKVFDTNVDVISPTFYFVLGDGKIKDATVAVTDEVLGALNKLTKLNCFWYWCFRS